MGLNMQIDILERRKLRCDAALERLQSDDPRRDVLGTIRDQVSDALGMLRDEQFEINTDRWLRVLARKEPS